MSDGRAPAQREHGWKGIVLALATFLLVSKIPPLAAVTPVEDTMLLLLVALGACFVAGWWEGGRLSLALIWAALATWWVLQPGQPGAGAYQDLARGWGLLIAGAFGVVCLSSSGRSFLDRALPAVGIVLVVTLIVMAVSQGGSPQAQSVFAQQFAGRNSRWAANMQLAVQQIGGQSPATSLKLSHLTTTYLQELDTYSAVMIQFYPAILALESLAGLAIAWGLYHRLSRARLGPPLTRLRALRFNDQLIWGLVVGLVLLLLPPFAPVASLGKNLLFFFGALYALRGVGVGAWFVARWGAWASFGVVVVALLLLPLALSTALVFGISDTWIDWRARAASASSHGRPGSSS
ncbi:MAG TPA: DUF2232 domain-containing protein [Gemmatimonadaceae bacterium]|nr:DUF2232 domain-containing protein [Gemmatimonadaceae bacterium]